jgi:hypothetical protein
MKVGIFEMDRGFSWWIWLCQKHLDAMRAAGWVVKTRKRPPHEIDCGECRREDMDAAR